ncbi:flagellar hook protein FlgE [Janthinobacterium lividum]|jgi:flagellar hook protein FlgE|uniref:Flagellar hook protein FlgE n=1 Tax=Janthinobacterium lividum TaxID=29581 RepID=A0AAJ4T7Y1_9BURK|nr:MULTISPECIES: flagellar hook-basal body complex protein [Janthinobacterium]KAB0324641.1 flagellar hook-basal body complex protein [Janthinobacterium lividum]KHA75853.1 flagellar hook protein FlgE [Janthinobacterium lividum]MDO8032626.1 flagellar hook-basal body complex protein [Janthinobacterium sp. SUN128]MDQ4629226.1 flagellar hook-basal body complex protein [Janthinobacterium lividum]MDQ4676299.1 flagellar hook-basal body complex protein [Janthinobacterium lividum]
MSFDIALSGIQSINQQLNSTSNNIANAGTYGFKSSRANFSAMYAGSRATGTEIGSLTQSMSLNGGVLNTGRALDAAIDGRGYFVTRDAQNTMTYSRVGIFSASNEGKLIDANGRLVQGYAAVKGSTTLGTMGDMLIPTGQIPAVASTKLAYAANMSSEWTVKTPPFNKTNELSYNSAKSSIVYDSLGAKHSLGQYFVKTATGVDVHYTFDNADVTPVTSMTFDTNGKLVTGTGATPVLPTPPGAAALSVVIDYTGTTQFAGEATTSTDRADGYASGTYTGVELADDGSVVAKYTNGQKQSIGVIALATFPDEGALTAVNDTSWVASTTSGTAMYDRPGVGMAGKLVTSSLEQSNVDITSELVGLMTSQRNYQANSKVISTENAMLQSLMQAL